MEDYARNRKNYVAEVRRSFDDPSVSEKSFDFYSKEDGTENTVTRNTSFFKMRLFFSVLLFFSYLFMNQTGISIAGVTCTKLYETIEENYDYTNLKKYVMISDVK
ncbi:MAG: hypothetical protein SO160_06465 [Lachnospiraceae bacterium]|nr:hypothetical protein [Lachnospiraceae bacterium]